MLNHHYQITTKVFVLFDVLQLKSAISLRLARFMRIYFVGKGIARKFDLPKRKKFVL
jgi:hypothetical protein